MFIKVSKSIIENILSNCINFTEKKDNSQITSHIYIEATDKLILKATDKEFGIKFEDNTTEIITQGKATINGKKFYDIIKSLNDDFINIEVDENLATISQNHSIYKLPIFDANEYPEFPNIQNFQKIDIDYIEFIQSLKKVFPVIDSNNPKYELNGALLDINENNLNIVATDTKRLAVYNINQTSTKEFQIIIPRKAIAEIRKLFLDNFTIYIDEINLVIKTKNITFFTQLINGKFPDYKRIIPNEYKEIISISKNYLLKAIKRINIISEEIKFTINKNNILLESITGESLEAKTDFEINSNLDNFTFAVNSKFLLDFLNVVDEENINLCLNEENIPFTIKSNNFQTIIMPLSI